MGDVVKFPDRPAISTTYECADDNDDSLMVSTTWDNCLKVQLTLMGDDHPEDTFVILNKPAARHLSAFIADWLETS